MPDCLRIPTNSLCLFCKYTRNISNPNKSLMDINHGYKLMKILKNIYKN